MLLWLITFLSCWTAAPPPTVSLSLQIRGIRTIEGQLAIALYNQAEGFPRDVSKVVYRKAVPVQGNSMWVHFQDLPAGDYAAAVLHDKNKDLKMNFNFIGYPLEGFGFSNDAIGVFAPPSYKAAQFFLHNPTNTHNIRLRYY